MYSSQACVKTLSDTLPVTYTQKNCQTGDENFKLQDTFHVVDVLRGFRGFDRCVIGVIIISVRPNIRFRRVSAKFRFRRKSGPNRNNPCF